MPVNVVKNSVSGIRRYLAELGYDWGPRPFQELRRWRDNSWRKAYPPHVVNAWMGHSERVSQKHYQAVTPQDFMDSKADPFM